MTMRRFLLSLCLSLTAVSGAAFAQTSPAYNLTPCTTQEACASAYEQASTYYSQQLNAFSSLSNPTTQQIVTQGVLLRDAQIAQDLYAGANNAIYYHSQFGGELSDYGYPDFDPNSALVQSYSDSYSQIVATQAAMNYSGYSPETEPDQYQAYWDSLQPQIASKTYSQNYQASTSTGGGETPPVDGGGGETPPPTGGGGTETPPGGGTGEGEYVHSEFVRQLFLKAAEHIVAINIVGGILALAVVLAAIFAMVRGVSHVHMLLTSSPEDRAAARLAAAKSAPSRPSRSRNRGRK